MKYVGMAALMLFAATFANAGVIRHVVKPVVKHTAHAVVKVTHGVKHVVY